MTTNMSGWTNTEFKSYGIVLRVKPFVDAQKSPRAVPRGGYGNHRVHIIQKIVDIEV